MATYLLQSFFFHYTPPLFLLPTGNRWEVKGVTCRGNGLLPLACQGVITRSHTQNSGGRRTQLAAITGAVQVHTHLRPAELMRAALSDPLPLCVPLNHLQHSVNSQIAPALLHQVLKKKKKKTNPKLYLADSTAVSYFCYQLTLKYHVLMVSEAQTYKVSLLIYFYLPRSF